MANEYLESTNVITGRKTKRTLNDMRAKVEKAIKAVGKYKKAVVLYCIQLQGDPKWAKSWQEETGLDFAGEREFPDEDNRGRSRERIRGEGENRFVSFFRVERCYAMTNFLCQDFANKVIRESIRKDITKALRTFEMMEFLLNCCASHQEIRMLIHSFYVDNGKDRATANDCREEWDVLMRDFDSVTNPHGKPITLSEETERVEGRRNLKSITI